MALVNPLVPNLADYRTFVYGLVFPAATPPYPYPAFPYATGIVSSGTTSTLTDLSANWSANQWVECVVFDVTQSWSGIVISNTSTEVNFTVDEGEPQGLAPAPGDQYLIVQPSLSESLDVALEEVNDAINCASPLMYTKAVYNLAADRLLNFGMDVPNETLLADARKTYGLLAINVGTVQSASDQGTSGSLVVPEQMSTFTMADIQLMKTPFGRAYIAIAQNYGSTIWGLS